ncbi:MAG TPA: hypothetical protein VF170_01545 [Planctomycetaceae bacterium]
MKTIDQQATGGLLDGFPSLRSKFLEAGLVFRVESDGDHGDS